MYLCEDSSYNILIDYILGHLEVFTKYVKDSIALDEPNQVNLFILDRDLFRYRKVCVLTLVFLKQFIVA